MAHFVVESFKLMNLLLTNMVLLHRLAYLRRTSVVLESFVPFYSFQLGFFAALPSGTSAAPTAEPDSNILEKFDYASIQASAVKSRKIRNIYRTSKHQITKDCVSTAASTT